MTDEQYTGLLEVLERIAGYLSKPFEQPMPEPKRHYDQGDSSPESGHGEADALRRRPKQSARS